MIDFQIYLLKDNLFEMPGKVQSKIFNILKSDK